MAKCYVCGNDYDKAFTVTMAGKTYTFDSFECRYPFTRSGVCPLWMQSYWPRG